MTRTQEEIQDIQKKVFSLEGKGEIQESVQEYIEILHGLIEGYQGELYSKNSEVSSLEYKIAKLENEIKSKKRGRIKIILCVFIRVVSTFFLRERSNG